MYLRQRPILIVTSNARFNREYSLNQGIKARFEVTLESISIKPRSPLSTVQFLIRRKEGVVFHSLRLLYRDMNRDRDDVCLCITGVCTTGVLTASLDRGCALQQKLGNSYTVTYIYLIHSFTDTRSFTHSLIRDSRYDTICHGIPSPEYSVTPKGIHLRGVPTSLPPLRFDVKRDDLYLRLTRRAHLVPHRGPLASSARSGTAWRYSHVRSSGTVSKR